jgi:hypothetical protein
MAREVRIKHKEISNTQTITPVMESKFKEQGLDIHVNEVEKLEDDYKTGERVLRIKNTQYHFGGFGEGTKEAGTFIYDKKTRKLVKQPSPHKAVGKE